jgi:hypothetical protein
MGILRHRRFRRQETVPNDGESGEDYEEGEEGDEEYDSSATTLPSVVDLTTSTENQFEKAKAIGKDVIEKVPSKYFKCSCHLSNKIKNETSFVRKINP